MSYCDHLTSYQRRLSEIVDIGGTPLGGEHPIRIQSMTDVDTLDTQKIVDQTIRMVEAGCDYVRITAPEKRSAQHLEVIKKELKTRGCHVPLIADIHYTPSAAEIAARIVEKVRINPGNYADKKKFNFIEYTDAAYQAELERIYNKFSPLVNICKEYGTAMRIGTNHGSLSDRILSRYGDTPYGMVESALEFVRICNDMNYHQLVLSMKASNPIVMVQAYRLLVLKLKEEDLRPYPLHLGVTEAGDGEDGRIKSAVGIGALLEDGLGDTIRVSLTEPPEAEVPVAKRIVKRYELMQRHVDVPKITTYPINPYEYKRRFSKSVNRIGGEHPPVVIADFSAKEDITPASLYALGYQYSVPLDKWHITDQACDFLFLGQKEINFNVPGTLGIIYDLDIRRKHAHESNAYPFLTIEQYLNEEGSNVMNIVYATLPDLSSTFIEKLKGDDTAILMIDTYHSLGMHEQRRLFVELINKECHVPVIIGRAYDAKHPESFLLGASIDVGSLLLDGMGDGVFFDAQRIPDKITNSTAFGILQATRTRISKTEYISCPSCGRTLFDLQETTAKIRARTNHLKGLKIGIMGCIVNGPGEMADADYGYVGSGIDQITLYRGQKIVARQVPSHEAVERLIHLIKEDGRWVDG